MPHQHAKSLVLSMWQYLRYLGVGCGSYGEVPWQFTPCANMKNMGVGGGSRGEDIWQFPRTSDSSCQTATSETCLSVGGRNWGDDLWLFPRPLTVNAIWHEKGLQGLSVGHGRWEGGPLTVYATWQQKRFNNNNTKTIYIWAEPKTRALNSYLCS